jgi:SAM-dependent methyltransferase
MSSFAAEWLTLREPFDHRSRNPAVLDAVAAAFVSLPSISVVDLGCGTAATTRAVGSRLPPRQNWRLVDNDLSLLARVPVPKPTADLRVTAVPIDINHDLEAALDGPVDLVTISALLDLVSAEWLDRLVVEAAARRLPVYAALTYDGTVALDPVDPRDAEILAAFHQHQQSDKGFGRALGATAAAAAVARFKSAGYTVTHGRADWALDGAEHEMQNELLAGWASAARHSGKIPLPSVMDWLTRRRTLVASRRSTMCVGHVDLFAAPTATR